MTRTSILALFALVATTGCVTKKDHAALQRELDATKATLADAQSQAQARQQEQAGQIDELGQALRDEEQRAFALERQVASMQRMLDAKRQELDALEDRIADSQQELASVLRSRAKLQASVDEMTRAVDELSRRQAEANRRVAEYRDMLTRFGSLIDAGKLDVRIVDGRMVLTLPMDILFASGSAKLSQSGRESLMEVGAGLATIPDKKFQVEGHTDAVPIHTDRFPSNWELASARSLVVVHALLSAGLAPEQLSAASYSEFQPRADNDSEEGRAANRRIEIVVVPDLSGLPGYDELEHLDGKSHGRSPLASR